jgi:hypothetical protein
MTTTISLIDWTVYETDRGTRHFVGRNKHGKTRHFLVSEPIERFDVDTRTGIDRNGQAWMLSGGNGGGSTPGAWEGYCWEHCRKGFRELTADYRITAH